MGKLEPNGRWRWVKTAGGQDFAKGILVRAAESGGCYVVAETGFDLRFEGIAVSTPKPWRRALCLAKYDSEGRILWAHPMPVPAADPMASATLTPVGIGRTGTLYSSGMFESSVLVGTNKFVTAGGMDFFVAKIAF